MIISAIACFAIGALLGTRFKVVILLPIMLAAMAIILFDGIVSQQTALSIVVLQMIALAALQFGYFSVALLGSRPARKPYLSGGISVRDSR